MKPFPHKNLTNKQQIFNYRLSRARRCVENAFGILANRFRVLLNPICLSPAKVDKIVMASCALHNLLRTLAPDNYVQVPNNAQTHQITQVMLPGAVAAGRRSSTNKGKQIREQLADYFCSKDGSLSWQEGQI
jgi:hypothetical protein